MEESMLKSNLEIQIVARDAVDERGAAFRAFVLGVRDSSTSSGRYVSTGFSERLGDATCDLALDNYYIIGLVWTLDNTKQVIEEELFDRSPESQNHAFQMIQEVIKCEGDTLACEKEDVGMAGPKRIEIELQRGGVIYQGRCTSRGVSEKKKIVVTGYYAPAGEFNHTVNGRVFYPLSKTLGQSVETFHSDLWLICSIEMYYGGISSSFQRVDRIQQDKAWERVRGFVKDQMTDSEKTVIRKWDPPVSDFLGGWATEGNYYDRLPSVYKAPVAEFRVSGDEIGAKIHLEQMERFVKDEPLTAKEVLAEADKKSEAEKSMGTKKPSRISAFVASGRGGSHGGFDCAYCQLPNCNGCEDDIGEAWGVLPFVGPGGHMIH